MALKQTMFGAEADQPAAARLLNRQIIAKIAAIQAPQHKAA